MTRKSTLLLLVTVYGSRSYEGSKQGRRLLKVRARIFGRETPLKLGYAEVEKVSFE